LTDGNGCQKKKQYEIKQPTAFTVGGVITDVKCNAESNGQIKLIINGGIEPYVFTWDNNENKEVLTDLKSGTYKVTVNDASKCMTTASFTVKQPDSLKLTVSKKDSLCSGFSGEAEVLVKGGTNPYTYEWITGAITKKESNLTKGQYDVTVTDKNECVAVQKVDIFIYDELKISLLELPPSCADGNDGKIEIQKITSGGIDLNLNNFTYKWSNKEITQNINNAKGSETYVVTVTNKQGCSAEEMIQNSNPEPVVINLKKALNPSCAKGDDGSIECEGKGGTTPYDFTWENGTILSQITNLKEGSYNVSMSDAKGCRTTASYNLTQPKSFTINTLSSSEKCVGNANGSAEVQTKDGSAPFKYLWNNGKSTAKIENIAAGNYTVTVTDAVGCVQYGAVKVDAVAALIATISTSPVSCGGTADGTFTVQPKGGTPPYLYSVNGGAYNGQYKRIGLRPNFYEVLVKDANDCIVEIATTVTEPNKIEIDLGKDTILKFGDSYRIPTEIKNLVSSNPKYDWFPDNPQHISCTDCRNPIVSPRISTLYTLTVKDSLGCKASKSVNIIIKVSTNIAVPTGFSPNGDGENDLLLVHGDEGATVLKFNVFDRWGNLLFEKENFNVNDKNTGWNGFFREESMPSGTYIWTLSVQFKNESVEYFKGSTQLIR
jgi:gliding motility-associated-like protein